MSWLIRTGTGRNNISWGGGSTTSGNYLKRTGTGRNNIAYTQISTSGTHNLLERTSTGRNNIRWNNLTFNFFSLSKYTLYSLYMSGSAYNIKFVPARGNDIYYLRVTSYLSNGYNIALNREATSGGSSELQFWIYFADNATGTNYFNDLKSHYTKVTLTNSDGNHVFTLNYPESYVTNNVAADHQELLLRKMSGPTSIASSITKMIFS